ncbi:hypothetical protein RHAL1_01709 [Beijerinckiaceae bacterium RH AL1]|nr:DUF2336 domain-containing protein [Beijerinckiaceae bacterium]VVB45324.1 hypothetical protein RHCH11_RHCH11_01672 [Beijerinckiaceae bacterium RH CH11]VVB45402.1 hypothetical protein RHAL8_01668 [Beijerinckiaceae bacterium RH AL8]VVC54808.1 hypothetical protein RHAL1_01709 [Beijerinckiaceae bacterium RH AL1]
MILEKFRSWAETSSPATRAEGATALARAYLRARATERQRQDAAAVLTSFLDDPAIVVRKALAEALAGAHAAPHHIVLALADDLPEIAAIVLARSPILTDAELIDCATTAAGPAAVALAERPSLPITVAALIAETADVDALVALAGNRGAPLSEAAIRRMIERHGEAAELRDALLQRLDLPMAARVDLVAAAMRAMAGLVADRKWMSESRLKRIGREARDRAAITIADTSQGWAATLELVRHLRDSGDLTLSLIFRSILSGKIELFKAALSVLSDTALTRVDAIVDRFEANAFAGLYRKAGLPEALLAATRIALQATREADWSNLRRASLSCLVIERVLTGCDAINTGDLDTLMVLLRRFESEARREATRDAGRLPHAGALRLERERFDLAPLLLEDLDDAMPARAATPKRVAFTVDLAAIEAELLAA